MATLYWDRNKRTRETESERDCRESKEFRLRTSGRGFSQISAYRVLSIINKSPAFARRRETHNSKQNKTKHLQYVLFYNCTVVVSTV